MKVFVFNGSRHRANSVCCMWIDQFMQLLKMSAPESIEFLSHGMDGQSDARGLMAYTCRRSKTGLPQLGS